MAIAPPTVFLNDLSELPRVFDDIANEFKTGDYSQPFKEEIAPELAEQHAEGFAAATDSNGNPWAPLSPFTIRKKGHDTILVDTKSMANSIVSEGHPEHVQTISARELAWGSRDEKLPRHMSGTSRMPARPAVGVTPKTADRIAEIVADATVEILKGA